MTVLLPQEVHRQIGLSGVASDAPPPVLYLLHGLSDDDTSWVRRTSIERYASTRGIAVVMPQVHRSFYADEVYGAAFWTFLTQELPQTVAGFFRVSLRPEDTYVAGLSMGGYGALKWALREPSRFAAAASMSGALDLASVDLSTREAGMAHRLFGDRPVAGTDDDLLHLLETVQDAPRIYVTCGTEDALIGSNQLFVERARAAGLDVTASFGPGIHEWALWDTAIRDVLAWMFPAAVGAAP